jgi:hypothetical protein
MARILYAAAPWWSGVKHRFVTLNHICSFTRYSGHRAHFVWGVSEGVGYCRFEELFAPVPGIRIINVSEAELKEIERLYRCSNSLRFRGHTLAVYRPGRALQDRIFAFDLWGDFAETTALHARVPPSFQPNEALRATPSREIQRKAATYIRQHELPKRVGIRIRVTENPNDGRKPRRIQHELDQTLRSVIRIPWYVRVFVVTDSEYVQLMLLSHFCDARVLPKRFANRETGGGYVNRRDPAAMRGFVMEVACLAACRLIVNIGGFINEEFLGAKIIQPPWQRGVFGLERIAG